MQLTKKHFFIVMAILAIIAFIKVYWNPSHRQSLVQKGRFSVATIKDFKDYFSFETFRAEPEPVYTFPFAGKTYIGHGFGIIQNESFKSLTEQNINQQYLVIFLPDKPQINSLLPHNRVNDTVPPYTIMIDSNLKATIPQKINKKIAPDSGWTKTDLFADADVDHLEFDPIKYH